jgi:hypothetical protein
MTLIEQVRNELELDMAGAWAWVQTTRAKFLPMVFDSPPAIRASFDRAADVTRRILQYLEGEMSLDGMCPGHGPGHWMRDYISACQLLSDPETLSGRTETEILAGFAGGVLHDIGNAVVDRYHDARSPVRHAEAAGLMLARLFERNDFGLSENEQLAIQWAVMAHTHYLRPQEVEWNGQTVIIEPYQDLDDTGQPLYGVWFPRMVDRLDCSGSATFVARHWLTLYKEHQDYGQNGFYDVDFHSHIVPICRSPDVIKAAGGKQTMLEHLRMFATSQSNGSPYGQYDYGRMLPLRDARRENLLGFVHVVVGDYYSLKDNMIDSILDSWQNFLSWVEPSESGRQAAIILNQLIRKEERSVQMAWAGGFLFAMQSYQDWAQGVLEDLVSIGAVYELPFVGNIHHFLTYDMLTRDIPRQVAA